MLITEINDMKSLLIWTLDMLKKQGVSFVVMAIVIYFGYMKLDDVEQRGLACNEEIKGLYKELNLKSQQTLDRNTEAFQRNTTALEKLNDYLMAKK